MTELRLAWARLETLESLAAQMAAPRDWMTEGEQARLVSMASELRRKQCIAGHWLLRTLAVERFGGSHEAWKFASSSSGEPLLHEHERALQLRGSISHCGERVAAAISELPIGLDVEAAGRQRNWLEVADAAFHPRECAQLRAAPTVEHSSLFRLLWTQKEAVGKQRGTGLRLDQARAQQAQACADEEATGHSWRDESCCLSVAVPFATRLEVSGVEAMLYSSWRLADSTAL